jgi:hypothetical protein
MYLSDDPLVFDTWQFPVGTDLCGGCWLLVWADGETLEGPLPLHTSFALDPLAPEGGFVGFYADDGTLIDYLGWPQLPADHSFGRFPDGAVQRRVFSIVTPEAANDVPTSPIVLNEYNAVKPENTLDNGAEDPFWGQVPGNGGDWFELVVTSDHLDARNWQLFISNDTGGPEETTQTLTLSPDELWSDLRAGTIITVSEDLPDDVSFDPQFDDWWINVQAADTAGGVYITAQDFEVSNDNWQLTIRNDSAADIFGPVGEGIHPFTGVNSREVFKLEEDPTPFLTPYSAYNDGTSSTFSLPNVFGGGMLSQDFTELRLIGLTDSCFLPDADGDNLCDQLDNCPGTMNPDQIDTDGDGMGNECDSCPSDPNNDADLDGVCVGAGFEIPKIGDLDNCPSVSNAGQTDSDSDALGDVCDNCVDDPNLDQADADMDGLGDVCDLQCPNDPGNDLDADGWCYGEDNCPTQPNPTQADADLDEIGDECDECPNDSLNDFDLDDYCDGAGYSGSMDGDQDNCPFAPNESQLDGDIDQIGDFCDNCPGVANAGQEDLDGDGQGDVCDDDDDDDGAPDGSDNCPQVYNPEQTDTDLNTFGDACDGDDDGDGFADESDNCPQVDNDQADGDGDGAGDVCDCAVANPSLSRVPGLVGATVRFVDSDTLTWTRGAQGHVSHVYRGTFSTDFSYDETCFQDSLALNVADDPAQPAVAGTGFFYLVSGENACGASAAGRDSTGQDHYPASACSAVPGDHDSDGQADLTDNCPVDSNTLQTDTDKDFIGDACDNCQAVANPMQENTDQDDEGDACDDDDDGDGVPDLVDNCPLDSNSAQGDFDLDGVGDACDPCTDSDGDGLGNLGFPNLGCPTDNFPDDPENDADGDGIDGLSDNCPETLNTDQSDLDQDGRGDACDPCPEDPDDDADGDGVCAGQCGAVDMDVALDVAAETLLIDQGSSMIYLANVTDPGIGLTWTAPGFVPGGEWIAGTYGIGYEAAAGAEALIQTPVPVGTASVYTRSTFEVSEIAEIEDVFIAVDFDDGVIAWINGLEVYRSPQMQTGLPDWNHEAAAHESSNASEPDFRSPIDITTRAMQVLQNGTNVLAIGVWNHPPFSGPSDDLVLVPRLSMNRGATMTYLANQTDPGIGISWVQGGFDDSEWEGGDFGVGYDTSSAANARDLIETEVPSGSHSVYTRAHFTIQNTALIQQVRFGADYDDSYVVWVNGTEVFRSIEMPPTGDPDWNTPTSPHESSNGSVPNFEPIRDITDFVLPVLQDGSNLIAIGVYNAGLPSSDLIMVPSLSTASHVVDNCPDDFNPLQADRDMDAVGDVCDNCPDDFNAQQDDSDGDGIGNACDPS